MNETELLKNDSIRKFFQIHTQEVSEETMQLISLLEHCYYKDGENIVEYGAGAEDGLYIILSGKGNVFNESGKLISTIKAGDFVGEMALISGKSRSATVQACGDLEAVRMSRFLFNSVVKKTPQCYAVLMETLYNNLTNVISERQRIKAELDVARKIQSSYLIRDFSNFDVETFASMKPAKEVGGDFYDIVKIDDEHICFIIADVSGKGVSAAMFMFLAKTMLKNYVKLNLQPNEIFEIVNNDLCESNDANMFVTVFMGILNTKTGELKYVNAGHNPPIIYKTSTKQAEYIQMKPGFVLAGLEDVKYQHDSIRLEKGDFIFMYTDGVTEAQNKCDELFGEDRLLAVFNEKGLENKELNVVLDEVDKRIFEFANEVEQADDITMLAFRL